MPQGQKTCLEVQCHPKPDAHVDTKTDALVLEPLPPGILSGSYREADENGEEPLYLSMLSLSKKKGRYS